MRISHPELSEELQLVNLEMRVGKTRLATALNSAISMPIVQQTFRRYTARQTQRSLAHHQALLEAFRARDPQWARAVMTAHIRAALGAVLGS